MQWADSGLVSSTFFEIVLALCWVLWYTICMKKLNKTVKTVKRGRYTDIFLCHDEMDQFGKIIQRKILFDTVLPYHFKRVMQQAELFLSL